MLHLPPGPSRHHRLRRRPGQLDDRDNHDDDDNDDQYDKYDDVNDYRVVNRERPNAQFLSSIVIFIKEF